MFLTLFKTGRGGDKFYTLHDLQKDFFSIYTLTIYFGIVGRTFNEKHYTFDTLGEREAVIKALLNQKVKEKFKIICEYSREYKKLKKKLQKTIA